MHLMKLQANKLTFMKGGEWQGEQTRHVGSALLQLQKSDPQPA